MSQNNIMYFIYRSNIQHSVTIVIALNIFYLCFMYYVWLAQCRIVLSVTRQSSSLATITATIHTDRELPPQKVSKSPQTSYKGVVNRCRVRTELTLDRWAKAQTPNSGKDNTRQKQLPFPVVGCTLAQGNNKHEQIR